MSLGFEPAVNADGEHELESAWTLWYDKKPKQRGPDFDYMAHMSKLATCKTVEQLWGAYSQLKTPSQLGKDTNYHLFREGLEPMWESFPKGGAFIKKSKKTTDGKLLDRMWEELVFAAAGEAFEDPNVVGIVVSIRQREDVLSIWTKEVSSNQARFKIMNKIKAILNQDPGQQIEFKPHAQSMRDGSSYRRTRRADGADADKADGSTAPLVEQPAGGSLLVVEKDAKKANVE